VPTSAGGDVATVLVVNRDGTIYEVDRNVSDASTSALDAQLQSMLVRD
jgi:hypothetical protein